MGVLGIKSPEPNIFKNRVLYNVFYKPFPKPALPMPFQNKKIQQIGEYGEIRYNARHERRAAFCASCSMPMLCAI